MQADPLSLWSIHAPPSAPARWAGREGRGAGKRLGAAEPMSALRRSGYGPSDGPSYGRYYGPGGGDVPVHPPPPIYPPRPEPPQPPISWRGRGGRPGGDHLAGGRRRRRWLLRVWRRLVRAGSCWRRPPGELCATGPQGGVGGSDRGIFGGEGHWD